MTPPPCGCVRVGEVGGDMVQRLDVSEDSSTEEREGEPGEACL